MLVDNVSTLILTAAILWGIFSIILYKTNRWRMYKLAAALPGPPGLPLIGNMLFFFGSGSGFLKKVLSLDEKYPSLSRLWVGSELFIWISSPELVKEILVHKKMTEKSKYLQRLFKSTFGSGLLAATGETWHTDRKLIASMLNSTILVHSVGVFATHADKMAKQMKIHEDGSEFEMDDYLSQCAFRMSLEAIVGIPAETDSVELLGYEKLLYKILTGMGMQIFLTGLGLSSMFSITPDGLMCQSSQDVMRGFAANIVQKKRELMRQKSSHPIEDTMPSQCHSATRKSQLEMLIELADSGEYIPNEKLIDQTMTLFTTSMESTNSVSKFVILMLAIHQNIQDKVYEELYEIYGDDDRMPNLDDLNKMNYLNRVILETLRLFPPVLFLSRGAMGDVQIGDHLIPSGASICIGVFSLHRNEKWWPDPLKFDPDRFLPEEIQKRNPYCYIPFGLGPRICPGLKYSMMTIKVIVATLLRKYVLRKDNAPSINDVELRISAAITLAEKLNLRLEQRKPQGSSFHLRHV